MTPQILPIGARVLILPYQSATQTESGMLMDNQSNTSSAPVKGTVIRAGKESQFKEGDVIFYRRYSMDILKTITEKGEETVNIVEDQDIIAIEK